MRLLPVFLFAIGVAWSQTYSISTVAGGGQPVNIAGTSASLSGPRSVAVDKSGNIYFADQNEVLRYSPASGLVTLVAGGGSAGFSGDDGLAIFAQLNAPAGIALDLAGNLYIADTANNRIRKVTNGVITTVAPAAQLFVPQGVALDSSGNLYTAESGINEVRKISNGVVSVVAGTGTPGYGGDSGAATSAQLNQPHGVAFDAAGNLYIADTGNSAIRKVTRGVITTVTGTGAPGYSGDNGPATIARLYFPDGVFVDSAGNLYVADSANNRIREVTGGQISTIAGNAQLNQPVGVAVDANGNVYVADPGNFRICRIASGTTTTVAGNGTQDFSGDSGLAVSAQVFDPTSVAVDSNGDLYITSTFGNRIRKVAGGTVTTLAGYGAQGFSGDNGPAASASLYFPQGVAVDGAGNVYFADRNNQRIRKISGGVITTVAGNGTQGFSGDGGPAIGAELNYPGGVAVDSAGNLYIADTSNARVRKVAGGVITTIAGNGAAGSGGDNGPAVNAQLTLPQNLAIDAAGNLYISDATNTVRKVSNGVITTAAGNGTPGFSGDGGPAVSAQLNAPAEIAVDSSGNLFIADSFNQRIRKVASGTITTIAGNGALGFAGDYGPAISAELYYPAGVAGDSAGNVYVADTGNNVVRVLTPNTAPVVNPGGVVPHGGTVPVIQSGSWISIWGTNLASGTALWNADFPKTLGGVSVTIDNKPAYLWYVSPTLINLQAPDDTATGLVSVAVTNGTGTATSTVTLAPYGPAFSLLGDGKHVAGEIATPNGSGAYGGGSYDLVGPVATFSYNTRPVNAGETLVLYGVGFGPTNPVVAAGQVFSAAARTSSPVMIIIGGVNANVVYAGITAAGLYQFNLIVPAGIGSGDQLVQGSVNSVLTPVGPVVTVQ